MSDFELEPAWFSTEDGDEAARATFGALKITAGPDQIPLTEVEDTIARTVRPHIFVPANLVAEWLLANWWRLRWEGASGCATAAWRQAHSLAAIGQGYAWPSIDFISDGEVIQVRSVAERASDVAGVRYLRDATIELSARHFEAAVDRFVDAVQGRLASIAPQSQNIAELRAELQEERARPSVARECRWQALAGFDPGEAPSGWLDEAKEFAEDFGMAASEEVFAVPRKIADLRAAREAFSAARQSSTTIDLRWTAQASLRAATTDSNLLPWQRGVQTARRVRQHLHVSTGPLPDAAFASLLGIHWPLSGEIFRGAGGAAAGFRNDVTGGRTAVLRSSRHAESERFYLARMIGCALSSGGDEHFLPVTRASTALQKFERAFAQELICPWADLAAFAEANGTDQEGISAAAEHFGVSEWLVLSTLVNRGALSRERLPGGTYPLEP